ncbi:MAG: hypothetical protein NC118_04380 [Eubacterium sp.]|nr:hypothetical protein [Eubacterium sp.]
MIDLNDKLESILKKYGLYKKDFLKDRIEQGIREVVEEYTKKFTDRRARIIVRGVKNSKQYQLLSLIAEYGNIIAVVDKKPITDRIALDGGTVIDVLDLEQAESLECDVYIINAHNAGRNIRFDVRNQGKKCYVVDLYTEIRLRSGIVVTKPYEEYESETDFSHHKTHEAYESYRNERNERHLTELLSACLMNRDFITFYEVIDEAGDLVSQNDNFLKLKIDIDHLICEVKRLIQDRKNNKMQDVILHWIDQVAYEELNNFSKLSKVMEKGLFFENAYTVTPYTSATKAYIFYSEKLRVLNVRDIVRKIKQEGVLDSQLVSSIYKNGYEFIMGGSIVDDCLPEYKSEYTQRMTASTASYWDMLNRMLHSEKPVFGMISSTIETHEPWMSPKCDVGNPSFEFAGNYNIVEDKIKESAHYFDSVIAFFNDILTNNTINIYMSDHGKWEDISLRRYGDFAMHSILSITNMGITGKVS